MENEWSQQLDEAAKECEKIIDDLPPFAMIRPIVVSKVPKQYLDTSWD